MPTRDTTLIIIALTFSLLLLGTVGSVLARGEGGGGSGASASHGGHAGSSDNAAVHSQAPAHMSEQGRANTNAQFLEGSTRGLNRAAERKRAKRPTHPEVSGQKREVDKEGNEKSEMGRPSDER